MTTIKVRQNGPYVVEGDVQIVDWNGAAYHADRTPVVLCRCGASKHKPFCDATHRTIAFDGGGPAAPAA